MLSFPKKENKRFSTYQNLKLCPHAEDPMPPFNWVFENLPIASGILTQPSSYKVEESNLLADEKGPQLSCYTTTGCATYLGTFLKRP